VGGKVGEGWTERRRLCHQRQPWYFPICHFSDIALVLVGSLSETASVVGVLGGEISLAGFSAQMTTEER